MMVDGKGIAERIYVRLASAHGGKGGRLGILVCGENPVIASFVRIKSRAAERLGVQIVRKEIPEDSGTEAAIGAIRELAAEADGVIVQLPLPGTIDLNAALSAIPDDKDVDAIATGTGDHFVEAPVARAVGEILSSCGVGIRGKRAVVVGAGRLVGAPTAALLRKLGADVSVITPEQGSIEDLKTADIVVCGAGNPGFIKSEMLKQGVVLIDAGTSEAGGKVVGDCDPSCANVASVFTPVPGGVGPVAVAMIFKNLFDLMEMGISH